MIVENLDLVLTGPESTRDLGRRLGERLLGGEVLALRGELGAGKTTLAQGLASGLGLSGEEVTSPTFVLVVTVSGGRLELNHVDLYRLDGEEAAELGLEELMTGPGSEGAVTVLEWAERAGWLLPEERLEIELAWTGPETRRALLKGLGQGPAKLIRDLARDLISNPQPKPNAGFDC